MSRRMPAEYAHAYRAIITIRYPATEEIPGRRAREAATDTIYAGPYATIGAARAAATRESRDAAQWWMAGDDPEPVVSVEIERSSILWEKVTEA